MNQNNTVVDYLGDNVIKSSAYCVNAKEIIQKNLCHMLVNYHVFTVSNTIKSFPIHLMSRYTTHPITPVAIARLRDFNNRI